MGFFVLPSILFFQVNLSHYTSILTFRKLLYMM